MSILTLIVPIITAFLIAVYGLLDLINPRLKWEKLEAWKAPEEPEPSFFLMRRLRGIVMIVIACGFGYALYLLVSTGK